MNGRLALMAGENQAATERVASVGTLLSGASSLYGLYRSTRTGTRVGPAPTPGSVTSPIVRRTGTDQYRP
jgi:hypothetical protein